MPDARYLLWDFGDTLADQRWMWPSPAGVPGWTPRYAALADSDLDARWNLGHTTSEELAAELAADLDCRAEVLLAHMEARCGELQFFERAWAAARARTRPQAIVTVNPDLFNRCIVPNYALDTVFDAIVTSSDHESLDKAHLCAIALDQLGGGDPAESLLIDNVEANVAAWCARGGQGYHFRGDAAFASDRVLPAP